MYTVKMFHEEVIIRQLLHYICIAGNRPVQGAGKGFRCLKGIAARQHPVLARGIRLAARGSLARRIPLSRYIPLA